LKEKETKTIKEKC